MIKNISLLFNLLLFVNIISAQTFETEISDTANYNYRINSTIYEVNNTYNFFLTKCSLDSIDYGNINYIQLDSTGNIITDTILIPNLKIQYCYVLKSSHNNYYIFTQSVDKTNDANGKILKLDSAFNIVAERNFPLIGDSTFRVTMVQEVENNNIIFEWFQFAQPDGWPPQSFMFKTDENLDSLHFVHFPFFTNTITNDTLNHYYVATPLEPPDTLFAYIDSNLQLDSVDTLNHFNQLHGTMFKYQNSLILLSNHKKIYSCSGGSFSSYEYLMGIYLLDNDNNVLNHHFIAEDAYPGEYQNMSYIPNSPYFYFVGTTNYQAYPEDSNSIILTRIDTNLNIDYVRYLHNDRVVRPAYIKTTQDNGCIIMGGIAYIQNDGENQRVISGAYIIKLDSLGNLAWSHGIDVQESVALVYPNPATDVLYVQSGLGSNIQARFILTDIKGRQVVDKSLIPQANQIDISMLPPGIYLYRIAGKDKIYQTGTIVKQ